MQASQNSAETASINRVGYLATTGLLQYDQDATRGLLLAIQAAKSPSGSEGIPSPAAEQALRSLLGRLGGYAISGPDEPQVTVMASSPTETRWVALGNAAGSILLWDLARASLREDPLVLYGHIAEVRAAAISPDNGLMVTGDQSGSIFVWDLVHLDAEPKSLATFDGMVEQLAISPESDWIAASVHTEGQGEAVYLWRVDRAHMAFDQGTELKEISGRFINSVLFSPDRRWLFVGGQDGLAMLWPLGTDERPGNPIDLSQAVPGGGTVPDFTTADFNPYSAELAIGRSDGIVDIWDTSVEPPILAHSLKIGTGITALGYGGNPTGLIVLGSDGRFRSWVAWSEGYLTEPVVHEPALDGSLFDAITLSREFPYMATQDFSGHVRLWHLGWTTNGNFDSWEISSHRSGQVEEPGVPMVLLTPDGRHLVSTGPDRITRAPGVLFDFAKLSQAIQLSWVLLVAISRWH